MENVSLCWRCNFREQEPSTGLCSECENLISEKLLIHKCEEEFTSLMLKNNSLIETLSTNLQNDSLFEDDAWFDVKVDGVIYGLNLTYDLEKKSHVVFIYKTDFRDGHLTTLTNEPIVGSFIPKEKLSYSFDN